jgi:protein-S-isoprenylcysteine O-methyltransferase Ste14
MKIGFDQNMSMVVKIRAVLRVIISIGLMFAIIFGSAGRWNYWHGWVYFLSHIYAVLFTWLIIPSELVQERIKPGPGGKKWDYVFYIFDVPLIYIIPLIAVLDAEKYHWTGNFPLWLNVLSFITIFLGTSLTVLSLWENRFFSSTVRIQSERGHYVIDQGPYAFIRHPGYSGAILLYLSIPFALNSLWALIPGGLLAIVFLIRTYLEDVTLQKELPGYIEYGARVRYRLIPGVW